MLLTSFIIHLSLLTMPNSENFVFPKSSKYKMDWGVEAETQNETKKQPEILGLILHKGETILCFSGKYN